MTASTDCPVHVTTGVIDRWGYTLDDGLAPIRFKLYVHDGAYAIATWCPPFVLADDLHVDPARVTLVPCRIDADTLWVATAIEFEPEAPVLDLIPEDFGADEEIVSRLRHVVDRIRHEALVRLINDIWKLRRVFHNFWTCPASQAHHHAYRGGLAAHTLEIAERVAETPSLPGSDRDLGIAYALLHDLGKLWCYGEGGFEPEAQLGHDLVTLTRLNPELDGLHRDWPEGAVALRSLISGLWKTKGRKPIMAVGKLVQAYDQMSAEEDLRRRSAHIHRAWAVQPYRDNVREFPVKR
ncbi:TraI domain-containing protein [Dokdonella sp.]|uniref:TraI domain-containing protein n=1 Tax=Dokdonella sp. TaxID=2291710 RepID=UPI0031C6B0AF|nr:TraI domain-containing protein [Dokdonella sp.]